VEKAYDAAQIEHGKPLINRSATPNLYFNLGAAYEEVGRHDEAIEAFRSGIGLSPWSADAYNGLAGAYFAEGRYDQVAVVLTAKMQVEGEKPATVSALREIYARVSGAECAANPDCPRLHADLCAALAELASAFEQARLRDDARRFRSKFSGSGCQAK
jgi:tetratricopeptide (TPR) repeat protein